MWVRTERERVRKSKFYSVTDWINKWKPPIGWNILSLKHVAEEAAAAPSICSLRRIFTFSFKRRRIMDKRWIKSDWRSYENVFLGWEAFSSDPCVARHMSRTNWIFRLFGLVWASLWGSFCSSECMNKSYSQFSLHEPEQQQPTWFVFIYCMFAHYRLYLRFKLLF